MKKIIFVSLVVISSHFSSAQMTSKNGEITSTEATYVNRNGRVGFTGVNKNGQLHLNANSTGQFYQGGIIGYILQPGDPGYNVNVLHGLIVTQFNIAVNTSWGCQGVSVGSTSTAYGTGQANTTTIVNGCGTASIAAKVCDDLVLNGYSDWFLPSRDEMNKMYINRYIVRGFSNAGYYWTSSQCDAVNATGFGFDNGDNGFGCGTKGDQNNIRAVRVF